MSVMEECKMVKEILLKTTIAKEKGYLYFVDKGSPCVLARAKMQHGGKKKKKD